MIQSILTYLPADFPWMHSIQYFTTIDSTNTFAKSLAAQGAPHGTVLIAGQQTGGRGRMGRSFHSPEGMGIYLSVILRPNCRAADLMHLTCAAGVAMCSAVENAAGIRPGIKWTNDLVYGRRKLAGILTELGLSPRGTVDYAVIGIGINCCQTESDFPEDIRGIAGSLASVTGENIDRAKVAAALMDALYRMDQCLLTDQVSIIERYRRDCITLGQAVSVVRADGTVHHGTALDIDEEGALLVRFVDGHNEFVTSGEVSIRGMYGYL